MIKSSVVIGLAPCCGWDTISIDEPYVACQTSTIGYYNCFQPVLHLAEKVLVPGAGQVTRVTRRYDRAQTPFDRLCATHAITDANRQRLQRLRDQTNPRQLRQDIYDLRDHLFTLPCAVPGSTEDVYQTLLLPLTLPKGEDTLVTLSFDGTITVR